MSWHAPPETLGAWVAGTAAPNTAAAVESHLVRCADCRAHVATLPARVELDAVWERVRDRVEASEPSRLIRALRVIGLSEPDALVLRAAPAYTAAWSVAVAVVVALTVAAAMVAPERMLPFYLLFAPLVPMAGVAAGFGPHVDPTYEVALAAPYSKLRTLLLRGTAVVLGSVPVTCAVGALLDPWWVAIAWLGPGLAAMLSMLAALTWVSSARAASAVAIAWTVAVVVAALEDATLLLVGEVATAIFVFASAAALAIFLTRSRLLATAPRLGGL